MQDASALALVNKEPAWNEDSNPFAKIKSNHVAVINESMAVDDLLHFFMRKAIRRY